MEYLSLEYIQNLYLHFLDHFPTPYQPYISLAVVVLIAYSILRIVRKDWIYIIALVILLPSSVPILKSIWTGIVSFIQFLLNTRQFLPQNCPHFVPKIGVLHLFDTPQRFLYTTFHCRYVKNSLNFQAVQITRFLNCCLESPLERRNFSFLNGILKIFPTVDRKSAKGSCHHIFKNSPKHHSGAWRGLFGKWRWIHPVRSRSLVDRKF